MYKSILFLGLTLLILSCKAPEKQRLDEEVMAAMGAEVKNGFVKMADDFRSQLAADPGSVEALLGLAETQITLYIFGFSPREELIAEARESFQQAWKLDSMNSGVRTLEGMLALLDWRWEDARDAFQRAIELDPQNLKARHWYSLYFSAMKLFDLAMAQSDTIYSMDPAGYYLIGRGSLLYFARRNEELKDLMIKVVAKDTAVAWGYDWLGMAYIELEDFENSIDTYYKAFNLSDGTVEVGGGLGHALGLAGEYETAKKMADFYSLQSKDHYLPPVQRAFIHIGIGEYDEAISLLEQAYEEHSWFLAFMQAEPWLDPLRDDPRFDQILRKMNYPEF